MTGGWLVVDNIEVGSRVTVPFGLHDVEGVVVRIRETGLGVRVTVELVIEGADEHLVTTYPREAITAVSAA
ncbi:hypothetical protein [Actinokineospora globicatena]|uniref:hypothetical protein n=1 Tax=Actinokineospora globicatena TaxID=103729 RepID=UPI0020A55920|nr:hypothetical protein [Actinokineospora globicatena]